VSKKIPTALGYIDSEKMGITSIHEHVMPNEHFELYKNDSINFAVEELKKAKKLGLSTIVEVSPWRDAEIVRIIAERAEMNIILCTGYYTNFNAEEKTYSVDRFRKYMMDEIENGIGKSGIFPGVIKIASSDTVPNEYEKRALIAAGMVQRDTGLPLCVHSCKGCKNQQDIFEEAGANLEKVYFSHVEAEFGWEGRSLAQQINYLEEVVKKGSTLSYNNFGNWVHTGEEHLVDIIKELNLRGYAKNQAATMDFLWFYEDGNRKIVWENIISNGSERTYSYLLKNAVPWLKANGINEDYIDAFIVTNPRRIFSS